MSEKFHQQFYGPENGQPIVFLHGLMGFAQNWRKVISGFEDKYRCLAYDQRGHGRSIKPESGYAPENYADDLIEVAAGAGFARFHLVGHSMGARNALNFAFRFPEKLLSLTLVDIGPEEYRVAFQYYEELLNLVPTPFADRAAAKAFFLGPFVEKAASKEDPVVLGQYFYANMEEKPDGSVSWRFSKQGVIDSVKAGRGSDRWHEVEGLKMPTLLIRGERSKDLSRETFEGMMKRQPLIKGVEIAGAGHWVHADQPAQFTATLRSFIDDNSDLISVG